MQSTSTQVEDDDRNPITPARLNRLRRALNSGTILILTHHNPDPDALASGAGLAYLLEYLWGRKVQKAYSGLVARVENIAMLKFLTPGWSRISELNDTSEFDRIVLVDTQPGAGNNMLPPNLLPAAVFDHHQPVRPRVNEVPYLDLRPEIGATATLVYQHLECAKSPIPSRLATALFYGIKTDTKGLSRGTSVQDRSAYVNLLNSVDHEALLRVENARRPAVFFQSLVDGLAMTQVYGSAVIANLGDIHRSDFAAELADQLITLEGARGVLCMGRHREMLQISVRTVPLGEDAGLLIQRIIHELGHGGGHGVIAGGQVPLASRDPDSIESELVRRFLALMGEENANAVKLIGD